MIQVEEKQPLTFEDFKTEVIHDYTIATTSRECSLLGRREVLTGSVSASITSGILTVSDSDGTADQLFFAKKSDGDIQITGVSTNINGSSTYTNGT